MRKARIFTQLADANHPPHEEVSTATFQGRITYRGIGQEVDNFLESLGDQASNVDIAVTTSPVAQYSNQTGAPTDVKIHTTVVVSYDETDAPPAT